MPLIGSPDSQRMRQLQTTLVEGISARRTRVAILDLTGVTSLSSEDAHELLRIAQAARLLVAEINLTGIPPNVARKLVELECDLGGIATHRTLQSGVAFAMQRR